MIVNPRLFGDMKMFGTMKILMKFCTCSYYRYLYRGINGNHDLGSIWGLPGIGAQGISWDTRAQKILLKNTILFKKLKICMRPLIRRYLFLLEFCPPPPEGDYKLRSLQGRTFKIPKKQRQRQRDPN